MRIIACDAKVAKLDGWVTCPHQTTPDKTGGWTLSRTGDYCPQHTRIASGEIRRAA